MLAEERQPAGLALHRRVPHMFGANWNQKTMPVVFLEQREHPVVPGLCWRHSVCSSLVPWLIRRIQPVFIVLCWEELFQLPQIIELDCGIDFAQRHEAVRVRFENRPLVPHAKRLIDVRIDTARRDAACQVRRSAL